MSDNETIKATPGASVVGEENAEDTVVTPLITMGEASTKKLLFYAGGIFVCYFYYGILQEKM